MTGPLFTIILDNKIEENISDGTRRTTSPLHFYLVIDFNYAGHQSMKNSHISCCCLCKEAEPKLRVPLIPVAKTLAAVQNAWASSAHRGFELLFFLCQIGWSPLLCLHLLISPRDVQTTICLMKPCYLQQGQKFLRVPTNIKHSHLPLLKQIQAYVSLGRSTNLHLYAHLK